MRDSARYTLVPIPFVSYFFIRESSTLRKVTILMSFFQKRSSPSRSCLCSCAIVHRVCRMALFIIRYVYFISFEHVISFTTVPVFRPHQPPFVEHIDGPFLVRRGIRVS